MTEQKPFRYRVASLLYAIKPALIISSDELLGFAERINPKRAFCLYPKYWGDIFQVSPDKMRQAFTQLATLIPDDLPGADCGRLAWQRPQSDCRQVHQVLQARYPQAILLNSTRHAGQQELFPFSRS